MRSSLASFISTGCDVSRDEYLYSTLRFARHKTINATITATATTTPKMITQSETTSVIVAGTAAAKVSPRRNRGPVGDRQGRPCGRPRANWSRRGTDLGTFRP